MSIFKWMITASLMAGMTFATVGCDTQTQEPPVEQTEAPDIEMPAGDAPADQPAGDADTDTEADPPAEQ